MAMTIKEIIKDELRQYDENLISYELVKNRIDYLLTGYFYDNYLEDHITYLVWLKNIGVDSKKHAKDPIINLINELEDIPT